MKQLKTFLGSLIWPTLFGVACISCDTAQREAKQLEGRWTIVKSERWRIDPDGTTEKFEDLEDAGYMEFTYGIIEKQVVMDYTNFRGTSSSLATLFLVDDNGERIRFGAVLCNDIFNCDLVWNVETDRRNQQVWTYYYTDPPNQGQFDYTRNTEHFQWTVTLKRD